MPTRLLPQHTICLYLAAPDCATHYHAGLLDAADRIHLVRHPARAAQTGWQVSRFLKQQAAADGFSGSPNFSGSLSHSGGHAVLSVPSADFPVGVDLERLRPRRFDAWPDWVLHADEARWLQQHAELADYYALWTLKEALLKTTGQGLAEMPQTRLRPNEDGWRLYAAGRFWQGAVFLLDGAWLCGVVWPQEVAAEWAWHGFGKWQVVEKQLLYRFV